VSHGQASLNLLSCLDTLSQLPDVSLINNEDDTTKAVSQKLHSKEDYSVVNRFV
jgi:anaerobic glycerol-3-phosphate dehydrogenase